MSETSTPLATGDGGGLSLRKGDYVLATKFADGDPCDHFCVGFVTRIAELDGRIFVANSDGVSFRANGFRRAEVITPEEGAAIVAAMPTFADKKGPSLWKRLEDHRATKAKETVHPAQIDETDRLTEAELLHVLEAARSQRDAYHDRLEGLDADALQMHLELGLPEFDAGQVAGEIAGGMARVMRDEIQDLRQAVVNNKAASSSVAAELEQVRKERDTVHAAAMAAGAVVPPSPATRPGEAANGLRTERVTLEITIAADQIPTGWPWDSILRRLVRADKGESVRVVEEVAPAVHRGSGVFDANGDEVPWEGVVAALQAQRIGLRADVKSAEKDNERLREQLESVADRAAAAETENEKLLARVRDWERVHQAAHLMASLESAPDASKWRMLKVGETVEVGDEMTDDYFKPWRDAGSCVGQEVASGDFAFRRRVPAPAASNSSGILTSSPAASGAARTATWFAAVGKFGLKNVCMAFNSFGECEKFADGEVRIIPLYATPRPAKGWLTAEERELIAGITDSDDYTEEGQNIAKALLARDTPPEVVLRSEAHSIIYADNKNMNRVFRAKDVIEALAAIGVSVKEVGK